MGIVVKYNNDIGFRRGVAFNRMYRSRDFKRRRTVELACALVFGAGAVSIWLFGGDIPMSTYIFYVCAAASLFLLARLLRAFLVSRRVAPLDTEREFRFSENGFSFGPVDAEGKMLETRWRDIDKVYFTDGITYILCMGKRHWIALDRNMFLEGTPGELEALIREKLPKRYICDKNLRRLEK